MSANRCLDCDKHVTGHSEKPTVLVVDDEPDNLDLFAHRLEDDYRVRKAHGGEEALDQLDPDIDVVLLDRRMPGVSGDDVLAVIRDRELDCRVAMVTAIEPGLDVIGMGFDDYLVKPVGKAELEETIERLLALRDHEELVQEYFIHASKLALLQATMDPAELEASDEYAGLESRFRDIKHEARSQLTALLGAGSPAPFGSLLRRNGNRETLPAD